MPEMDALEYSELIHRAEHDHHEARMSAQAANRSCYNLAAAIASGQLSPAQLAKAEATLAAIGNDKPNDNDEVKRLLKESAIRAGGLTILEASARRRANMAEEAYLECEAKLAEAKLEIARLAAISGEGK